MIISHFSFSQQDTCKIVYNGNYGKRTEDFLIGNTSTNTLLYVSASYGFGKFSIVFSTSIKDSIEFPFLITVYRENNSYGRNLTSSTTATKIINSNEYNSFIVNLDEFSLPFVQKNSLSKIKIGFKSGDKYLTYEFIISDKTRIKELIKCLNK